MKALSKEHDILTNLRHITTRSTSSIEATPEPAPIAIYVLCSSPVRITVDISRILSQVN
jgi:hypothetical protein